MLIHPSSGACDLCVELFHGLYLSGMMCVGVTLWLQPASGYCTTPAKPQRGEVAAMSVSYTPDDGHMMPETCRESLQ